MLETVQNIKSGSQNLLFIKYLAISELVVAGITHQKFAIFHGKTDEKSPYYKYPVEIN